MPAKPAWPPRAPAELGADGKKLWRQIIADADESGLILNAVELALVHRCAQLADRIASLEAAFAETSLE